MDPEASVLLHFAPWRGLREGQVQVELSERYNRQQLPGLEKQIEEVWRRRVAQEPWLFNGAKFRLHSATLTPELQVNHNTKRKTEQRGEARATDVHSRLSLPLGRDRHSRTQKWVNFDAVDGGKTEHQREETETGQTHKSNENVCEAGGAWTYGLSEKMVDDTRSHMYAQTCDTPMRLTDGSKTQEVLSSHCFGMQPDERCECTVLTLRLGLTYYKDFLGTNWSQNVKELMRQGTNQFGDPKSLLAQPLGVGAVLRTTDNMVVFLRRSQKVAEASGLLDIPGGHPEPKVVSAGASEDSIQVEQLPQEAVVRELFSSIQAEIRDEVNLPLSCLSKPILMGIAVNHTSAGRPSAEFYVSCSLTAKEVKDFYLQGGPEASESTDIIFLSQAEVMQLDDGAPLWSDLCPSAKGAVMLYRVVLPDED